MPGIALDPRVRLFGIRHHGPGSARSLIAALDEWQPDFVLVEGPSGEEQLIPHLVSDGVQMPVAMLHYVLDTPRRAAYYPLAEFSPEFQAFRWACTNGRTVRLIDLPASASLGFRASGQRSGDSLECVAQAAGFEEIEDWWEQLVEQRSDSTSLFEAIETLMVALREADDETPQPDDEEEEPEPEEPGIRHIDHRQYTALREAHMRRAIHLCRAETNGRIAVVCGAWHVPALRTLPPAREDDAKLRGLPKAKVGSTVVPWTYELLTSYSGYGAGARSPAFYELLWKTAPAEVPVRWLLSVANLMRREDLDASPASVIEAVRLSDALASLRGRPRPGLRELSESAISVLVPEEVVWNLIGKRLIVGERMGHVPDTVPLIPLQTDLTAQQKRLRMKVDEEDRKLELDLRGEIDLERSHLLHRLQLLGIGWGVQERVSGKQGTFHEHWRLRWQPHLAISLIEASVFGNTVLTAAANRAANRARSAKALSEVAALIEHVLLADLPDAVTSAVKKLQELSATSTDVAELADAMPPLAAVSRYGSVRRTDAEQVSSVLDAIFVRACVGLPPACVSLDDDGAFLTSKRLAGINEVVRLLGDTEKQSVWLETLQKVADLPACHPLVMGKAERLRFDIDAVSAAHLSLRLTQEASAGATALETAAFLQGLLDGPGAILVHQEGLLNAVDDWIVGLSAETFDEILPLIRRTFALFTRPERRQIGERLGGSAKPTVAISDIDDERAQRVTPILRQILGLNND